MVRSVRPGDEPPVAFAQVAEEDGASPRPGWTGWRLDGDALRELGR